MPEEIIESRYLLEASEVGYLVGRIMTIIESLGLPEGQQSAVKSLVKQELNKIYDKPAWLDDKTMGEVLKERSIRPRTMWGVG